MKILYFDCFSGISGDMTVAAMISAGLPIDFLREALEKLSLPEFHIHSDVIERSMISARTFKVHLDGEREHINSEHAPHLHSDSKSSHKHNNHRHDHSQTEFEETNEIHIHSHGLSYSEIVGKIAASGLSDGVKDCAIAIFKEIARAESKIHNVALKEVHFHEVGAIDSIVDIVSVAIGMEYFGVEACWSRMVPLGNGGFVRTAHGVMPVPTPAALEILTGYPTEPGRVQAEMTTPTGAGILKALSSGLLDPERTMAIDTIGYGAGSKDFTEVPNLLRIMIGTIEESTVPEADKGTESEKCFAEKDTIVQLTTTIDDMPGNFLAFALEKIEEAGAIESYLRSVQMKKGRPGHELVVLLAEDKLEPVLEALAMHTTTIGVRIEMIARRKMPRKAGIQSSKEMGEVRIKRLRAGGNRERSEVEFEELRRLANEKNLSLAEVLEILHNDVGMNGGL